MEGGPGFPGPSFLEFVMDYTTALKNIDDKLERIEGALLGDNSINKPGLIVRVDRVEHSIGHVKRFVHILSGIFVAVITAIIVRYI